MIHSYLIKLKTSKAGSSIVLMICTISAILLIASILLISMLGFYLLNKKYMLNEDLYAKNGVVGEQIEGALEGTIAALMNDDEMDLFDGTALDHENKVANTIKNVVRNLPGGNPDSLNPGQYKNELIDHIDQFFNSADPAVSQEMCRDIYDIVLKCNLYQNDDILSGTSSDLLTNIKSIVPDELVSDSIINNVTLDKTTLINAEEIAWINDLMDAGPTDSLPAYPFSDYSEVKYTVEILKDGMSKQAEYAYQISSNAFNHQMLALSVDQTTSDSNNTKIGRHALNTSKILTFNGNGSKTINGDIYAFGYIPIWRLWPNYNPAYIYNYVPEEYDGIIASNGGTNQTVTVKGDVITRSYLKLNNSTIDIEKRDAADGGDGGDLYCDTLYVDPSATYGSAVIKGNMYAYDDIRILGTNSSANIYGDFYGMGSDIRVPVFSSSIVLNNQGGTTASTVNIQGSALVGGLASTNYVWRDPYMARVWPFEYSYRTNTITFPTLLAHEVCFREGLSADPYIDNNKEIYKTFFTLDSDYRLYSDLWQYYTPDSTFDPNPTKLINYFIDYIYKKEQPTAGYDKAHYTTGITINESKMNYAKGLIAANGLLINTHDYTGNEPSSIYYKEITGYSNDEYNTIIASKKAVANEKVGYLINFSEQNNYNGSGANGVPVLPNPPGSQELQANDNYGYNFNFKDFFDFQGILFPPITSTPRNRVTSERDQGHYYYYINNNTNASSTPIVYSSACSNLEKIADNTGKNVLIFTTGAVNIIVTQSDLDNHSDWFKEGKLVINGSITALEGITINSEIPVEINCNSAIVNDILNQHNFDDAKYFLALGNQAVTSSLYQFTRNSAQNVRMISKTMVQN